MMRNIDMASRLHQPTWSYAGAHNVRGEQGSRLESPSNDVP